MEHRTPSPSRLPRCLLAACVAAPLLAAPAMAGVLFSEPDGGWDYIFEGQTDLRTNPSGVAPYIALDGTWRRDESTNWDSIQGGGGLGTKPGDGFGPLPNDPPGGVVSLLEDTTNYLRIQDTGLPEDWGYEVGDNHNGKFWFGHGVQQEHPTATSIMSGSGITITFRARLASGAPLDPIHPQTTPDLDPEFPDLDAITTWGPPVLPLGAKGYNVTDDGQGIFTVEEDGIQDPIPPQQEQGFAVGFALALDMDTPSQVGSGLVMNNKPGGGFFDLPGSDRAINDGANIVNIPEADLLEWREFWITIQGSGLSGVRSYDVSVYRDGMTVPETFLVRSSNGGQYTGQHIAFGLSGNSFFGAADVDFFGYKLGVHLPAPEPEANLAALAAVGALVAMRRKRRLSQ